MRPTPLLLTILLIAVLLGCSADAPPDSPAESDRSTPVVETSTPSEPPEAVAVLPPAIATPRPGAGPELPSIQVRPHSVEELLRLPAEPEAGAENPVSMLPESTGDVTDPLARRGDRRVRLEFSTQTDRAIVPGSERTQTDVGVSLGVGDRTRLRAGVRVDEEEGLDREETPTLGIERQF